jgi:hypothetical protein
MSPREGDLLQYVKKYLYAGLIFFVFGIVTAILTAFPEEEFAQGVFLGATLYNFMISMLFFSLGIRATK